MTNRKRAEPVCRLSHRLKIEGGPCRYVCCDSRECLYQEMVGGVKCCRYGDEEEEG